MVIRLRPECLDEYKRLHEAVWPEVLKTITQCHIRNYSIYRKEDLLFSYFEYHGEDFAADMARMAVDEKTQQWWALCKPCMAPFETRGEGEWWAQMEEWFHHD